MNLEEINNHLKLMDESLQRTNDTGDVAELYQYNVSERILREAIYGNPWLKTPPTFNGHLHVEPKYYYLLSGIKNAR